MQLAILDTDKIQDLAFAKMFNLWKLNDTYTKKLA